MSEPAKVIDALIQWNMNCADMDYNSGHGAGAWSHRATAAMLDALRAENARLREALVWYAKEYDFEKKCSQWDGGVKARAALAREVSMRLGKQQVALLKRATQGVLYFQNPAKLHALQKKGLMTKIVNGFIRTQYRLTPAGLRVLADIIEEENSKIIEKENSK